MFRKFIFIALGSFAFASHGADMPISSDRNLLSDTAPVTAEAMEGGEAEGFYGSIELKYTGGGDKWSHDFSYRARASWKGEVNEASYTVRHAGKRLEVAVLDLSGDLSAVLERVGKIAAKVRALRNAAPGAV